MLDWLRRKLGPVNNSSMEAGTAYDGEELCYVNPIGPEPPPDPRDLSLVEAALHLIQIGIPVNEVLSLISVELSREESMTAHGGCDVEQVGTVLEVT